MPRAEYKSVGVKHDVHAELTKFAAGLTIRLGYQVSLSEAIEIAMSAYLKKDAADDSDFSYLNNDELAPA